LSVTVKLHASVIDVLVNGELRLEATDAQFNAGRVALIGPANASVQFADVLVRKYAPQEPATTVGSAETRDAAGGGWFGIALATAPATTASPAQATAISTDAAKALPP